MKKKADEKPNARKKTPEPVKAADLSAEAEVLELGKLIKDAPEIRELIVRKIEENPTEESKRILAEFDETLEIGKRRFSKMAAAEFKRQLKLVEEELTEVIENVADDEEFLRLGEESEAARRVQSFVKQRPVTIKALSTLHPDDGLEALAFFNKIVSDAHNRLKEKRDRAETRFPQLKKVYEMDDHYKQAMADLLEAINVRDDIVKALKIVPPNRRAEGIRIAAQMTKKIEQVEQALANDYETHQKYARAMDDMRRLLKSYSPEELTEIREHFRKNPGTMEAMEKMLAEEFPA